MTVFGSRVRVSSTVYSSRGVQRGNGCVAQAFNYNKRDDFSIVARFRVLILAAQAGRPGSSEVPRNPLTRWDVSSIPANEIFLTKKLKNKIKMPNG